MSKKTISKHAIVSLHLALIGVLVIAVLVTPESHAGLQEVLTTTSDLP